MDNQERESTSIMSTASLLRSMGSITNTSGRGLIMFRCLVVSATTAAIGGLCGAYFGGILGSGGGHFFVIGSCIGYVSSSFYFYRNQVLQAFAAFDNYPELMRLHLMMNFPLMRFQKMDLRPGFREKERAKIAASWHLTSMLAAAYQTATPSIDEVHSRKEQTLIAELVSEEESGEETGDQEGDIEEEKTT